MAKVRERRNLTEKPSQKRKHQQAVNYQPRYDCQGIFRQRQENGQTKLCREPNSQSENTEGRNGKQPVNDDHRQT
ncbi:MAG: hypothetical protein KEFWMYNX_000582 [Candidatus Fervidibacter sp.]